MIPINTGWIKNANTWNLERWHSFLKFLTTYYTDYTDFFCVLFRVFCVFRGPNIKMPLKAYIHRWRKPGEKNDRGF